jgi:UDP-N-acetylglucosamine 1-carboxyvinyltransferase
MASPELGGGEFRFAEDFHEAVTFMALGAITGGQVTVKNSAPEQFPLIDRTFAKFGVQVVHEGGWSTRVVDGPLRVKPPFTQNILQKIEAAPWPYLPVDLLPIFVALGVRAEGSAMFWNKVYEGAMGWTSRDLASSARMPSWPTRTASSPSAASRSCRPRWRAPTSSAWPSPC